MQNIDDAWKWIPSYIEYINNDYYYESFNRTKNYYKNVRDSNKPKEDIRVHLLMLEGPTDIKLYKKIFSITIKSDSTTLNLSFDNWKKYYIPNDYARFMGIEVNNNVNFIKEFIDVFNENRDSYKYIDFYGFIDRDYHHDIRGKERIKKTTEHDGETNLIYCYLDKLFDEIENKEKALDVFSKAAVFTYKQGILGKLCTLYLAEKEKIGNYSKGFDLKEKCHKKFKKNISKSSFSNFDLERYLNDVISDIDNDFANYVFKSKEYCDIDYFDELKLYFKKWLISHEELDVKEKSRIKRCLEYSNGHILISQLIINGANYFGIEYDEYDDKSLYECERMFVGKLINCFTQEPQVIYKIEPLADYKNWRSKNNYFYNKK